MNKKTIISVMVVAMLVTVSLYFVGGTYARYTDALSGTAKANIAKWSVKVDETDVASSKDLTLNFTTDENDYVTTGKIAPGSSISATVELDLTDTEVAVDILGNVDTEALTAKIGTSKFTTEITVDGKKLETTAQTDPTIVLGEVSGTHTVKLTVTWDNDGDKNSAHDTTLGRDSDLEISLPVTLTVQQHIAEA